MLNNTFDTLYNSGVAFPEVPDYIKDNLAYELREYQKQAIGRFLHYYSKNYKPRDNSGNELVKSPHLLWQMATGSGKTLIMAAMILEMYKRGQRNFWFFVTSNNIIAKTIDNFTNSSARKYQFAQKIEIDGQIVQIRQVENFDLSKNDFINIKFSTINILHQISQPEMMSENAVTLDDFCDIPLVLIGDEAHHLNAATKKEKEDESTWESSVQLVLNANPENRLFEFTATANLTNELIARKYSDKLLYNYDLRHFRNAQFSKDVFTQSIDIDLSEVERIMLRTILISQYRKHIALNNGINLKPVILFKSKGTNEKSKGTEVSKDSFDKFNEMIRNLSVDDIEREFAVNSASPTLFDDSKIWNKTVKYFTNVETYHDTSLQNLISELKFDFDVDTNRVLIHDGTNKRRENQDKLVNTLEENNNPVRAIFAVNVLDEGWDVLNLFDIVRLYDTRDGDMDRNGNYKPGKGTISEAQLIGRGARYFPFLWKNGDRFRRKFDDNEAEPLRVIEQMHYHCHHNPSYISELRQTLIESGIIANPRDLFEYELVMKDEYKDGNSLFKQSFIYENAILPKKDWTNSNIEIVESELIEQEILEIPNFANDETLTVRLASGETQEMQVFEDRGVLHTPNETTRQTTISETIPTNILRFALNSNKNFSFDKLKIAYPKLKSMSEYIELLNKKRIAIVGAKNFSPEILLQIAKFILKNIEIGVKTEQKKVYVTKHFQPCIVSERFEPYITRKVSKTDSEVGKSQNNPANEKYQLDLSTQNWYVYNDNFGTSEEKSFIKWFAGFVQILEQNQWEEIKLARNEKAVKLYSWFKENLGEGFEPDFVLFMKKDNVDYVFYIEPKGDWTYDKIHNNFGKEQWKEDFLLEIESVVTSQQQQSSTTVNGRIIGLPFYNENNTKLKFANDFKEKTGV